MSGYLTAEPEALVFLQPGWAERFRELTPRAPRCRCYPVPLDVEVEWAVRWDDEDGGVVAYGASERARGEAEDVARRYGWGTPESRVSVVHRTVTYGPWTAGQV